MSLDRKIDLESDLQQKGECSSEAQSGIRKTELDEKQSIAKLYRFTKRIPEEEF